MIRNGAKYLAFTAAAYVAFEVVLSAAIHRGYDLPQAHPYLRNTWIVERDVLSAREWNDLHRKHGVWIGVTWVFATSGTSITLPSDYNTSSNQWNAIGAGSPGGAGQGSFSSCPCAGTTSGAGGDGGGSGMLAAIFNYSGHSAGQIVSIQVGAGDTWFNSTGTLLAKAANGRLGAVFSTGVGSVLASGADGGHGGQPIFGNAPSGGGGGGGGGAGGLNGNGSFGANGGNGQNGTGIGGSGGTGGAGDGNTTPHNQNGTEFAPNPGNCFDAGSGGGGDGGTGGYVAGGNNGLNGGFYGAGGGGGGGGGSIGGLPGGNGGNATQGLLAGFYTPSSGGAHARGQVGFVFAT